MLDPYDIASILNNTPLNERTEVATTHVNNLDRLAHSAHVIIYVLPENDRASFVSAHIKKVESPYIFSLLLGAVPEKDRLKCALTCYGNFTQKSREECQALACVIRLLPEEHKLSFALTFSMEIKGDWLLKSILATLPQESRLDFVKAFLQIIYFHAQNAYSVLESLNKSDRFVFYSQSKGDYFTYEELQGALHLIDKEQCRAFINVNIDKMLPTLVTDTSISFYLSQTIHPIYYALQRAFNIIRAFPTDDQISFYKKAADFFNCRYAIETIPYNPNKDNLYFYLRNLESNAVTALVTQTPLIKQSALITQYSGHYFSPTQARNRELAIKKLSNDDLVWADLIYLHNMTLGLRGVTHDDMAINEANKGGTGDAVSLANFGMTDSNRMPITLLINEAEMLEKHSPAAATILKKVKEGIKAHIESCFNFGYSVAFELISRGSDALSPYDFQSYPLGKCGKSTFQASQVKKIILRNDAPEWDVDTIYKVIVNEIKQLRLNPSVSIEISKTAPEQSSYSRCAIL